MPSEPTNRRKRKLALRALDFAERGLYEGNPLNMPPPVQFTYLCPTVMTPYSFPADAYKG
jgi:hypothetical protein